MTQEQKLAEAEHFNSVLFDMLMELREEMALLRLAIVWPQASTLDSSRRERMH